MHGRGQVIDHPVGACLAEPAALLARRRLALISDNQSTAGQLGLHIVYTRRMASEDTTTVRIRRPDSERLQSLARERQTTVIEVLHSAIDALERREFLRGMNQDYQHLRDDPERWQQYVVESKEWDVLA